MCVLQNGVTLVWSFIAFYIIHSVLKVTSDRGSISDKEYFSLGCGPTQPPVKWVLGVLSSGVKRGRGVNLTIYPLLVTRLRKYRSYTSSPPKLHP
jgi:hypothetical protein